MVNSLHSLHCHSGFLWTTAHHLPLLPSYCHQGRYFMKLIKKHISKLIFFSQSTERHDFHPRHYNSNLFIVILQVKSSGARVGFSKRRRSERKVTRMVVVIVVVFVLCWLPFFIINMVNLVVIIPESSATAGIYFFAVILSYANSCANPFLYGFLSDNFKQSFRKVR